MSWARMLFKDQAVWVRVGADGRPVLDSEGRAEMKYREADERSYRPAAGNLAALTGPAPPEPARRAARAGAAGRAASGGSSGRAAKRPVLPRPLAKPGEAIHVWTDGACTGNPGPMGIGVVVIGPDVRRELGEYLGLGTNNIAELVAIERGLELAAGLFPGLERPVRVYSDSAYSIGLLSQGWKAKANQELVARLRQRVDAVPDIGFVKVAGHAGIPENERCDELARRAIQKRATV
jgi:ribonuclease HI